MCATCGCNPPEGGRVTVGEVHEHPNGHDHGHGAGHGHDHRAGHDHHHHGTGRAPTRVRLEEAVLERNGRLAAGTRAWLESRGILALNLMSSPGAGKTTLLERTIRDQGAALPILVVEGDQATDRDAERVRAAGARAVQVNTGAGCHLDADMVGRALDELGPPAGAVVAIENVGNLVCPAMFDLGEQARVLVMSVTEGEDKPLKYPHMFRGCDLLVLNKIDLLPHVEFDAERCLAWAREARPGLEVLRVSATRGDGLDGWYGWIAARRAAFAVRAHERARCE
jgi:hydrogenase nickel incorporation protein HypB